MHNYFKQGTGNKKHRAWGIVHRIKTGTREHSIPQSTVSSQKTVISYRLSVYSSENEYSTRYTEKDRGQVAGENKAFNLLK